MEFIYQAKTKGGEMTQGVIEAHKEDEAVSLLHEKGLVILSLEPKERGLLKKDVGLILTRPSAKDVVSFTRQLATLIDADVPLVSALNTLAQQTINPAFKRVMSDITELVDAGSSLSEAFEKYPKVFSEFYKSLIRSGETAGKLHEVLTYLADYLEKQEEIKSRTYGALIYPVFLLIAVAGVFFIMFFGFPLLGIPPIIPQILSIVEEAGVEDLPFATRFLIFANNLLVNFWYVWLLVIVLLAVWLFNYLRTPEGRQSYDRLKLRIPFLKKVFQGIYLARLSETLSTLVKAGVPILDSIEISSTVVGNRVYQGILEETKEKVSRGSSISDVFRNYPEVIPPIIIQMISIGEKTGKLDFMLEHISNFYSREVDMIIRNLPAAIEPIVILFFGVIVFIMISGVLLPLFSIIR